MRKQILAVFLVSLFALSIPSAVAAQEVIVALRHRTAGGGITLVQGGDSAHAKAAAYGTTVSLAYPTNPVAGDCLILAVSRSGTDTSSAVSTNLEGTLTNAISNYGYSGGWLTTAGGLTEIYYKTAAGGGTDTVTATSPNAALSMQIWEFRGLSCSLDQTGLTGTSGTALSVSTSAATTHAAELSLASFTDQSSGANTITVSAPYAGYAFVGGGNSESITSEYKILSSTGTQTANATDSASATTYQVIATFY